MVDVFFIIKSTIGNEIGIIVEVQTFFDSLDRPENRFLIRRVSRMRLDENRYAVLVDTMDRTNWFRSIRPSLEWPSVISILPLQDRMVCIFYKKYVVPRKCLREGWVNPECRIYDFIFSHSRNTHPSFGR